MPKIPFNILLSIDLLYYTYECKMHKTKFAVLEKSWGKNQFVCVRYRKVVKADILKSTTVAYSLTWYWHYRVQNICKESIRTDRPNWLLVCQKWQFLKRGWKVSLVKSIILMKIQFVKY